MPAGDAALATGAVELSTRAPRRISAPTRAPMRAGGHRFRPTSTVLPYGIRPSRSGQGGLEAWIASPARMSSGSSNPYAASLRGSAAPCGRPALAVANTMPSFYSSNSTPSCPIIHQVEVRRLSAATPRYRVVVAPVAVRPEAQEPGCELRKIGRAEIQRRLGAHERVKAVDVSPGSGSGPACAGPIQPPLPHEEAAREPTGSASSTTTSSPRRRR